MKYVCLFFTFFYIFSSVAQDDVKVDVRDSLTIIEKDLFIADYSNRLNIKFEVSNEIKEYFFPYRENVVKISPNIGIRYALVFNYRFLSVRLGIRSKPSSEEEKDKGNTDQFQLSVKLLFDKWIHRFEYVRVKGYYVKNSYDLDPIISDGDNYVQFPDLTTNVIAGTSAYKFNDKYSIKASQSQTEIQLKSAGSFVPSIDYWLYVFNGADKLLNGYGDEIDRIIYSDFVGFNTVVNAGYYYTFVLKKWYADVYVAPGIGVDMYKETVHSPDGSRQQNQSDFVLSVQSGAGIGYNSDKYYFGVNYLNRFTDENRNNRDLQFQTLKNSFFVFFGYRFKAPKTLSKPVDYIEKKVPILKNDKK